MIEFLLSLNSSPVTDFKEASCRQYELGEVNNSNVWLVFHVEVNEVIMCLFSVSAADSVILCTSKLYHRVLKRDFVIGETGENQLKRLLCFDSCDLFSYQVEESFKISKNTACSMKVHRFDDFEATCQRY